MMVGQINALVGRMKLDLGEKLHYYEVQDTVHDSVNFSLPIEISFSVSSGFWSLFSIC